MKKHQALTVSKKAFFDKLYDFTEGFFSEDSEYLPSDEVGCAYCAGAFKLLQGACHVCNRVNPDYDKARARAHGVTYAALLRLDHARRDERLGRARRETNLCNPL